MRKTWPVLLIAILTACSLSVSVGEPTAIPTSTTRPTDISPSATLVPPTFVPELTTTPTATPLPMTTVTPLPGAPNLVKNWSFEDGSYVFRADGDQRVATNWLPFWTSPLLNCHNGKPHFEIDTDPPTVSVGLSSARFWTANQTHSAGLMQTVGAQYGVVYLLSADGRAWSPEDASNIRKPSMADYWLRVGIDPLGRQNPGALHIVWSDYVLSMDHFTTISVAATAYANEVTIFLEGNADWCMPRNDAWYDRVSLRAVTEGGS